MSPEALRTHGMLLPLSPLVSTPPVGPVFLPILQLGPEATMSLTTHEAEGRTRILLGALQARPRAGGPVPPLVKWPSPSFSPVPKSPGGAPQRCPGSSSSPAHLRIRACRVASWGCCDRPPHLEA